MSTEKHYEVTDIVCPRFAVIKEFGLCSSIPGKAFFMTFDTGEGQETVIFPMAQIFDLKDSIDAIFASHPELYKGLKEKE